MNKATITQIIIVGLGGVLTAFLVPLISKYIKV